MSALSYQFSSLNNEVVSTEKNYSKIFQEVISQNDLVKFFCNNSGEIMQGMFQLESGGEKLFPLFRGLIGLGKPNSLELRYSIQEKSIFFTYQVVDQEEVDRFFTQVVLLLQKEVKFKGVLKEVIENQLRFRSEQSLLHRSLLVD
ncbi:hypothetical protein [Algoriphagus machipongonensis]|uniref:Uncharacterized protein n=1 Tax=Algoriphagus machipongonensis TaxID=388413 RepID=A3HTP8_9BACT|nr:hypothetical protein [Algoriphagus machipongonensis]EAZ83216.1 hypothetical protein ALPR1_13385 [Algoriphagus machipongonensis]